MMKPIICLVALVAMFIPNDNLARGGSQAAQMVEPLFGLQVNAEGVIFQVFSGGCTTKESFRLERFQSDPVQLLLVRLEPDLCEAVIPYGTTIQYSYESLGLDHGQRFIVLNPQSPIKVVKTSQP